MKGIPVIREDFRKERILIAFNPLTEKFEVYDAAIAKNPEFISDISLIWSHKSGIFGVAEDYIKRLKESREVSDEEITKIQTNINNLDNIKSYPFTVLEVSSSANEEDVSEIFVRVNSKGTPLNQADFILNPDVSFLGRRVANSWKKFCRQSRTALPIKTISLQ